MAKYYNPESNTGPPWDVSEQAFDTEGCTHKNDMPPEAQEWFERPAREGYQWLCLNGKWPEEVLIVPSLESKQAMYIINGEARTERQKQRRQQQALKQQQTINQFVMEHML